MPTTQKRYAKPVLLLLLAVVAVSGVAGWLVYQSRHKTVPVSTLPEPSYVSTHATYPGWKYGEADPKQRTASKDLVIAAADKYVINKVGGTNFRKLFTKVSDRNSFADPKDSAFDFIAYYFKPYSLYTTQTVDIHDAVTFVQVNRTRLGEIYEDFVPNCVKNAKQCDFAVSLEQARAIGMKNGLTEVSGVVIGQVPKEVDNPDKLDFALHITSCPQKEDVLVDYASGKVLGKVAGCPKFTTD